ncbi:creatininase family protein [Streptomyces sp. NBC_01276]|uniref:creatininase family protein n=1 Tax=Streptomyces sp. NBC_01276 TaxID=2903808 RepID=UPI00352E74B6
MRVHSLTWPEYAERIHDHLVVLPIGAIEAHGPHLPLGTDTILAGHLADQLATRVPALVLPPLAYGFKTDPLRAGGEFPGMTNLRATTMTGVVQDILTASYRHGARCFLILHGHIANTAAVFDAADTFLTQAPDARIMAAAWWDFAPEDTRNEIAAETGVPRTEDHHAALVETSLTMHVAPEDVRAHLLADDDVPRRPSYLILPAPEDTKTKTGVIYRASKATPEIGARLMPAIIDNLTEAVKTELAS